MENPEQNLKPREWIQVGAGVDEKHHEGLGTAVSTRHVEALKAQGGFLVNVFETWSARSTFSFASPPLPGKTITSFIPANSIEEIRDIFFEEKHDG